MKSGKRTIESSIMKTGITTIFGKQRISKMVKFLFLITILLVAFSGIQSCSRSKDEEDISIGYNLKNTEWIDSESRVLRFLESNVATYRNAGNSYVLKYIQSGNNVTFTISGNSSSDWTGTVEPDGSLFILYKDEYVVYLKQNK